MRSTIGTNSTPATVAASPSTRHPGVLRSLLRLGRFERLAALGAIICLGSLLLPWYEARFTSGLGKSGIGRFGFAEGALVITLAAALMLLVRVGGNRRPPLPLHEGTLLAASGIWAAAIVGASETCARIAAARRTFSIEGCS